MFTLVQVQTQNDAYAIHDSTDNSYEVCSYNELLACLRVGIQVQGVSYNKEDKSFTYSEEFFIPLADEDEEDFDAFDDDYEESEEAAESSDEDDADYDEFEDDFEAEVEEEDEDELPDLGDYDDDYVISSLDSLESKTTKFYKMLEGIHGDLYRRYYLWLSQIVFSQASASASLGVKTGKQLKLQNIQNSGSAWVYAGFVDLGYDGAGQCTLGHSLRYLHYAIDAGSVTLEDFWQVNPDTLEVDWDNIRHLCQTGQAYKFGINCVADFFNIPKEDLMKIQKIQRNSVAEVGQLYDIMSNDVVYQNAKNSFRVFEWFADSLHAQTAKSKILGKKLNYDVDVFKFYKEFKANGLVYPRSLVKQIQNIFLKRQTHELRKPRFTSPAVLTDCFKLLKSMKGENPIKDIDTTAMEELLGSTFRNDITKFSRLYMENLLNVQSGGIYAYNPASANPRDRDEGMKNKDSWEYYRLVTGVAQSDEGIIRKIMTTYAGYPFIFNQICRASNVRFRGEFDDIQFTLSYIAKLCQMEDYLKQISKLFSEIQVYHYKYDESGNLVEDYGREPTYLSTSSGDATWKSCCTVQRSFIRLVGSNSPDNITTLDALLQQLQREITDLQEGRKARVELWKESEAERLSAKGRSEISSSIGQNSQSSSQSSSSQATQSTSNTSSSSSQATQSQGSNGNAYISPKRDSWIGCKLDRRSDDYPHLAYQSCKADIEHAKPVDVVLGFRYLLMNDNTAEGVFKSSMSGRRAIGILNTLSVREKISMKQVYALRMTLTTELPKFNLP